MIGYEYDTPAYQINEGNVIENETLRVICMCDPNNERIILEKRIANDTLSPAGEICIKQPCGDYTDYSRSVDISTGLSVVKWKASNVQFRREAFVSRSDGVFVMRLCADGRKLDFQISQSPGAAAPPDIHQPNRFPNRPVLQKREDGSVYMKLDLFSKNKRLPYLIETLVRPNGGETDTQNGIVHVNDASCAVIIARVLIQGENEPPINSLGRDYYAFLRRHVGMLKLFPYNKNTDLLS